MREDVGKHRINLVAGEIYPVINRSRKGILAVGFPDGDFLILLSPTGTGIRTPAYYESVSRSVNGYFNAGMLLMTAT